MCAYVRARLYMIARVCVCLCVYVCTHTRRHIPGRVWRPGRGPGWRSRRNHCRSTPLPGVVVIAVVIVEVVVVVRVVAVVVALVRVVEVVRVVVEVIVVVVGVVVGFCSSLLS